MRLRLTAALAVPVLALLAAGCSATTSGSQGAGAAGSAGTGTGSTGSTGAATIPQLTIGDDGGLTSALDVGQDIGDAVYGALETLTKFGPSGQTEPELATSWTHPSAVTYVYQLRHGVKFWNGDPLTSADVVNALNYYRVPGSYTSTQLGSVKSVTATGPYTVTVTLKYPYAPWDTESASAFPIFEKKFQDQHKTTMGQPGTLIMGSGPWEIDSFDSTTGLTLSANPHWWGGTVPVKHITVKLFANETSEALAFRAGEVDVSPDVLNPKAFASTSGASIVSTPAFAEGYFGMNVNQAPWNDIHVRRAVAYALNRADIISALGNKAVPVSTLIPPDELDRLGSQAQVNALIGSLPSYPFSLEAAKQELAQSAYPHGFSGTLETIAFGSYTPVDEAISADLAKIGINLKLKVISFNQYIAKAVGPKSAIADWYTTFNVSNPDPDSFPSQILGSKNIPNGGYNTANYDPPEVDTLLQQGVAAQDQAQRLSIYGQLLKRVGTDLPYVSLYDEDYNVALSSKFTWPGYNVYTQEGAWPLNIKPKN
jgi:peptide/nickel transport system substrate-binding protein